MMINVMVNQTVEVRGADSQSGVTAFLTKSGSRFAGLPTGTAALQSALASSPSSSACQHVETAQIAFNEFWGAGGAPFSPYNAWRATGTLPPASQIIVESTVIDGTTFFQVAPRPRPLPVRRPAR
jgi:hypothetical protein